MPIACTAPAGSNVSIIHPTSPVTVAPNQCIKKEVAGIEAQTHANAEESNGGTLKQGCNTDYGVPYNKRKRPIDDTEGLPAKRQIAMSNPRLSATEWVNATHPLVGLPRPKNPTLNTKHNVATRPQTLLRPVGDKSPEIEQLNKVIVISTSDNEDDDEDGDEDCDEECDEDYEDGGEDDDDNDDYYEDPDEDYEDCDEDDEGADGEQDDARIACGILPKDSHQDDIIVNSTELDNNGAVVGIAHYIERLSKKRSYKNISTTFDQYRTNGRDLTGLLDRDRYRSMCPAIQLDMSKDYTKPPKAHHAADITTAIYQGETCNPLVCLAIIRVAQANLPFINFSSALNHLTNLSPADPFPQLPKEPTFVDDIAHMPRAGDKIIKTLFIPGYYTDGRHALGYYVRLTKYKTSILFTPCTEANLQQLGLVATFEGDTGAWEDAVIATNKGTWKDKEDESFSWTILFNWVAVCWKDRLRLIMGGKESPW